MAINGLILVNKERGVSCNRIVNKVKHLLKAEKAGHLGTLDVLGEGLLPVALGKGTKVFDFFLNKDKVYLTTFKFGETTPTLDLEGEITQRNDVVVNSNELIETVKLFEGRQLQMPPQYSAKKIGGQKAYALARQGKEVELKPKEIEIYSIQVVEELACNTFLLKVHCSSGTYIRSLCRDIASKLSTYGVMLNILRTKCGGLKLEDSFTISEIENGIYKIIPLETLFDFDIFELEEDRANKLLNGVNLITNYKDGKYKIFQNNQFLGVGRVQKGVLKLMLRLI